MTLSEIFKSKQISDDVIKEILEEMKTNKIFTSAEENMDIRYGKLKTDHEGLKSQLDEANKLIEEFKKSSKGNEGLQEKITAYEGQVAELQNQLIQTKIDAAIKVGLLNEKALDVDYLTFKLKEKGSLELDENGKIKGWDDKIAALKVQIPSQFEGNGGSGKKVDEHKLPEGSGGGTPEPKDLADALRMQYESQD